MKTRNYFLLLLTTIFLTTTLNAQSYRYLKLLVREASNCPIQELDWNAGGTAYPTQTVTAYNAPSPVVVTGDNANWEVFRPYDNDPGTHGWVGNISDSPDQTWEIMIDLGSGNGMPAPESLGITKTYGQLYSIIVSCSEDNINWDIFLDTTSASSLGNGSFELPLSLFIDTEAPSKPVGVKASYITDEGAYIYWEASTDNLRVTEYDVYQNGSLLGSNNQPFYGVSGLSAATGYSYYIIAKDKADNESVQSDLLTIQTAAADAQNPTSPGNLIVSGTESAKIHLEWDAATDDVGINGYIISLDAVEIGITDNTYFSIPGLDESTSYNISVVAKDMSGKLSAEATASGTTTAGDGSMIVSTNFWYQGWGFNPFKVDYENVTGSNPWKNEFICELRGFNTFRFMQTQRMNDDPFYLWEDRITKDNSVQIEIAYEWMIDLCNRLNADLWITIPNRVVSRNGAVGGTENYIKKTAILIKTGVDMKQIDLDQSIFDDLASMTRLDFIRAGGIQVCEPLESGQRLILEYGNENWNGSFWQTYYCRTEGQAMGLSTNEYTAGRLFNGYASTIIFNEMMEVFGDESPRLIKVHPIQSHSTAHINEAVSSIYTNASRNPSGVFPDAFSGHTYFGHGLDGATPGVETAVRADMTDMINELAGAKTLVDNLSTTHGKDFRLICYEGGTHLPDNPNTLNRDPVIYDIMQEWLDGISPYLEEVAIYCHAANNGFGLKEWVGDDPDGIQAYRYKAVYDWMGLTASGCDTQSPTAPANLVATNVTMNSVSIAWDAATDNIAVTGYQIFMDGTLYGTTQNTSFEINALNSGSTFTFNVIALDATGNVSDMSTDLDAITISHSVTFTVNDGSSPIEGAYVTFASYGINTTNASGIAIFDGVMPSTGISYTVTALGYQQNSGTINVDGDESETVSLTEAAAGTYNVTFTVNDGSSPISGALVTLTGYGSGNTDQNGQVLFTEVSPATISYSITANSMDNENGSVTVGNSDLNETVSMSAQSGNTYSMVFLITDNYPNMIEGVTITLTGYGSQTTGSDGKATFTGVAPEFDISYEVSSSFTTTETGSISIIDQDELEHVTVEVTGTPQSITESSELINVFPNPAQSIVNIQSDINISKIELYNCYGALVNSTKPDSSINSVIDINNISSGLYILRITDHKNIIHNINIIKK